MVDERYTAGVLLGMTQVEDDQDGSKVPIKSSANICSNSYVSTLAENKWLGENLGAISPQVSKRVRRRGKYTPQERENIRYEEYNSN